MAQKMDECCEGLAESANGIVTCCTELQKDPSDNVTKANLLEEGKAVLKQMVALLQFNDFYDVMVCLQKVTVAEDLLLKHEEEDWAADDFAELIRGIGASMDKRQGSTHDVRVKQMLQEARTDLEKLGVGLATLVKRSASDPSYKSKIPILLSPLNQTFEKSSKAIKLSSKSPFDLSMLDSSTEFKFHEDNLIDEITVTTADFLASLNAVKKAIKAGDEFELERAIRSIEKDLEARIEAAQNLADLTSDPYLKEQMMGKINVAKSEMGSLLEKLRVEGQQALTNGGMENIESLLSQVQKMYNMILDGTAMHELLKAGESLDRLLDEIPRAVDAKNDLEAISLCKDVSSEIERLTTLANSLVQGVDDRYRKQRIIADVEKLKELSHTLDFTTRKALRDHPGAREELDEIIEQIREHNTDLNLALSTTTVEEMMGMGSSITGALKDLKSMGENPFENNSRITSSLADIFGQIKVQTALAKSWASLMTDDPALSTTVLGKASNLDERVRKLGAATKQLLSGPQSGAAFDKNKKKFLEQVDKTISSTNSLVSVALESPEEQMEVLQGKLIHDMRHLKESASRKDLAELAHSIADTRRDAKDFIYLANLVASDLDDKDLQKALFVASENLTVQLNSLADLSKEAVKTNDTKKLDQTVLDIENSITNLLDLAGNAGPADKMVKNAEVMSKLSTKLAKEIKEQNWAGAESKLKDEKKKVKKQIQLAKTVSQMCDFSPELSQEILSETSKLQDLVIQLEEQTLLFKDHPAEIKYSNAVQNTAKAFSEQALITGELAKRAKQEKVEAEERKKEELRLAEERRKAEAAERELEMSRAIPVGIKEIWAAAQEVQNITVNLEIDDSPVGKLIQLADRLAKAMQQLAALSRTGTKKEIIDCARTVASLVSEIEVHIQGVTNNCRDPHLNRELTNSGQVAKNFSVQLKIICGVKAGLILDEDQETAQSLIVCAKGLCKSVGEVVKLGQISKLKPKK
eukprot:TRINITY_DN3600_c5_g1_i1.p1 TRINITY_DN3600_c5_g1~~TRINITY_DN3600_c5_g1_i1.p1  ORF type:complete len:1052 (+),score=276.63 TRINITY_DN3600_c5_g1_i1:212-3157(+)